MPVSSSLPRRLPLPGQNGAGEQQRNPDEQRDDVLRDGLRGDRHGLESVEAVPLDGDRFAAQGLEGEPSGIALPEDACSGGDQGQSRQQKRGDERCLARFLHESPWSPADAPAARRVRSDGRWRRARTDSRRVAGPGQRRQAAVRRRAFGLAARMARDSPCRENGSQRPGMARGSRTGTGSGDRAAPTC